MCLVSYERTWRQTTDERITFGQNVATYDASFEYVGQHFIRNITSVGHGRDNRFWLS